MLIVATDFLCKLGLRKQNKSKFVGKSHFSYYASGGKWGLFSIASGLSFGVLLGVFIFFNPLDNNLPDWLGKTIGVLFIIGGAGAALRGLWLWRSGGVWNIEVTDKTVTYQVPRASREKGFCLQISDISHIEIQEQPSDSDAEDLRQIIDKNGAEYPFGYGENMFNSDKFMAAIAAQGIEIRRSRR